VELQGDGARAWATILVGAVATFLAGKGAQQMALATEVVRENVPVMMD
jgi:hypothetical protein